MSSTEGDRDQLVARFCNKYAYDAQHAQTVAVLADQLADRLATIHDLDGDDRRLLRHACLVHDVGYFIAGRRHHRHSQYLVNEDQMLEEYPRQEREMLALLARAHRKDLPRLPKRLRSQEELFSQAAAILRVADGLDYHHQGTATLGPCHIGSRAVVVEVGGVDLPGLEQVLRRKAKLFGQVFEREASFVATALARA